MSDAIMMMMGGGVAPETTALINRFSTPPTGARRKTIDNLVRALKVGGVWSKLDVLYVLAAADSQAALLNWKGATYNATNNGAAFTADQGFTGDGTNDYIETGYQAGDGQFTATSRHFSRITRTGVATNQTSLGASGSGEAILVGGSTSGLSVSDGSAGVGSGLSSVASVLFSRSGSTGSAYRNGGLIATVTTSAESPAYPFFLLAQNIAGSAAGFYTGRIVAASFGGYLTATDAVALNDALQTYLTAVGA